MRKEMKKKTSILLATILIVATFVGASMDIFAFETFTKKSPYSGVAYSTYYHNSEKFKDNLIVNGVDVSEYQSGEKSNYKTAKKNGVDFAIVRTTWTGYTNTKHSYKNVDSNWKNHFKKARDNGVMTGLYCFSQAKTTTEAKNEANFICDTFEAGIKEMYGSDNAAAYLDLPIYMDYEFAGPSSGSSKGRLRGIKKSTATKCAKKFCETIASRGYTPGIYANVTFLSNTIDGNALGESYEIWAAQYYKMCERTGVYNTWQYSSAAKIGGICNSKGEKTSADVNFKYLDTKRKAASSSAKDIANCSISGNSEKVYTGEIIEPTVKVKFNGNTLKKGTDYTVGYINNIKKGTAYVYVRGIGAYSGYKVVSFKIVDKTEVEEPKEEIVVTPTTLKTLTGKKQSFKATWNKKTDVKGYQVQYSRYKDMSYNLKKKVTSYKTTSKTFNTNFRNYKYYVRIRTYKVIDGTTYYSKWSSKKTVNVK